MSDELSELRQELALLRAEVQSLRRERDAAREEHPRPARRPSSRREVLKRFGSLAGLAAVGGTVAATAGGARPAAAIPPTMETGISNPATASTEIRCSLPLSSDIRTHLFSANDGSWLPGGPATDNEPDTGWRAAIGGYAGTFVMHGGFFQTNSGTRGSAGVRVEGQHPAAYGIRTRGRQAAILIDRYDDQLPAPARLDSHIEGEVIHDSAGDLWFCVQAGSPGSWRKLSGPSTSGQTHLLAVPVRCYDSREGSAPTGVVKGLVTEPRLVDCRIVAGGGAAVVPADATGLIVNVTVTDTTANGFVAVYPGGTAYAGTSLLNFAAGESIANSTSIGCGAGATLTVRCGGGGVGNIIIDVSGFYR